MIVLWIEILGMQLIFLRLGFLDTDHIGFFTLDPFEKTFFFRRANSIDIYRDNFHSAPVVIVVESEWLFFFLLLC
jgi:hypothetical protein